jgi:hypothetical protein
MGSLVTVAATAWALILGGLYLTSATEAFHNRRASRASDDWVRKI